jgi:DNA-binding CsgD family transcriptional regulator
MRLPDGRKLTPGETRAAVCRVNGLNAKEASKELHCSATNVHKYWQSIYFKLNCSDVVVAINKMIELGALHRLEIAIVIIGAFSIFEIPEYNNTVAAEQPTEMPFIYSIRPSRTVRPNRTTRLQGTNRLLRRKAA